uniref:Uncharacterized protein n=1 Tax=Pyxicephalus adspersus TaxID=30357 RepID=A0AAV2ZY76_PYXAD|nr:TPA: hypothetical protein GDO54_003832 [Pyxicephalus adspersus]
MLVAQSLGDYHTCKHDTAVVHIGLSWSEAYLEANIGNQIGFFFPGCLFTISHALDVKVCSGQLLFHFCILELWKPMMIRF